MSREPECTVVGVFQYPKANPMITILSRTNCRPLVILRKEGAVFSMKR